MTNSSRENDTRASGPDDVATPPEPGIQAPRTETLSGTAGGASLAPRQFPAADVFETLVQAIAQFESNGKHATAAGVSARMRLIRPGFSVSATEFKTFRDITQAAENAGLITSSRTASDYVLALVRSDEFRGQTLRPDLWRAIQDWTDGVRYAFNRTNCATEPVGATLPPGTVPVPSVDKTTNTQWMRDFVATQHGEVADSLSGALAEGDPVAGFLRYVRANDSVKRRWSKYLRSRVLETATSWAVANGIPRSHIFEDIVVRPAPALSAPGSGSSTTAESSQLGEDPIARHRVLEVLASMPLHELLRLPVPLEYSLKR